MAKNRFKVEDLKNLNEFLGTNENIESHTNCMTRFRFQLKDKEKVDIKAIKEISFVRGTTWAGNQLQVIIGPEVTLVRDEYLKVFPNNTEVQEFTATKGKKTFKQKVVGFIQNVFIPMIPVLMAAGLINAFYQVLVMTNALQSVAWAKGLPVTKIGEEMVDGVLKPIMDTPNIQSIVFFIIADTGLKFIGLFVGFNMIKYISKGQVSLAMNILVPLTIAAPYLFASYTYHFFSIGAVKVNVQSYSTMLLPQIGAGVAYVYLDRWIKSWIPMVLDLVFRHFLTLLTIGLLTFFAVGPVLGLVETGIFYAVGWFQDIPYGFGVGIFGFLWLPLVLTGMHSAVVSPIWTDVAANGGNASGVHLAALHSMTSITTIATCLAVFIRAKEATMKNIGFGSFFPAMFGISEPTYYSISMLRPILFLPAMLARGATGFFVRILDIKVYQQGGRGVLGFTSAIHADAPADNLVKYLIAVAFIFSVCFILTMLMYRERKNDKKQILKLYNTITRKLKIKKDKTQKVEYKAHLTQIVKEFDNKEFVTTFKELEKLIIKQNNLKFLMQKDEGKKESKKKDIGAKAREERVKKIEELEIKIQSLLEQVENVHLRMENKLQELFTPIIPLAQKDVTKANNIIFNTVHDLETNYKIVERMEV